jgi:hypothetical protein
MSLNVDASLFDTFPLSTSRRSVQAVEMEVAAVTFSGSSATNDEVDVAMIKDVSASRCEVVAASFDNETRSGVKFLVSVISEAADGNGGGGEVVGGGGEAAGVVETKCVVGREVD